MKKKLPPKEYYESLAKVPTSGAAVIRNSKGELLIVKPNYKDYWEVPGGMTELNETPRQAVIREIEEELGIQTLNHHLFCIDFAISEPFNRILFVFDCGTIDEETTNSIRLEQDELVEYQFLPFEEAFKILGPQLSNRLKNSVHAIKDKTCVYLENGNPIN